MKVTGGCHCGQITYEAEIDPATVRVCHCTDCQKLTGTAFRANIRQPAGDLQANERDPEDLHQDRREREQTCAWLLPGVRHADLFRCTRAEPVNLRVVGGRDRPAGTISAAEAAILVPFRTAVVNGFTGDREV
jgi:Glutathione-dependent formaldehyde-activating enzyme